MYDMSTLLSTRIPRHLMERLKERARRDHTTPSRIVRDVLIRELGAAGGQSTALERTKRHVGAVRSRQVPHARDARAALDAWAPDRRG